MCYDAKHIFEILLWLLEKKFILAKSRSVYSCTSFQNSSYSPLWSLCAFLISEIKSIFAEDIQKKVLQTLNTIPTRRFQKFAKNYSTQVSQGFRFYLFEWIKSRIFILRKSSRPQYLVSCQRASFLQRGSRILENLQVFSLPQNSLH